MRRKVIITAIGLLLVMINGVNAQISRVAYFMNIPQNHFLNPAIKPATRFYIGIPILSGINIGLDNNFLKLSDFITPGIKGDSAYTFNHSGFDLKKVAAKLNKNNVISADASIQLLGLGFPIGKNYAVFIDVTDRFTSKILFPKELLSLYIGGPADFLGKTINISNANFKGQYFREYAAGFSGDIIPNLRIGARLKLLSGITSLSFDDRSFSLTVNNDLSQTVTSDASMDLAGKDAIKTIFTQYGIFGKADSTTKTNVKGFLGNYIKNPLKNPGFGIDLGAVYNIGTLLTISVAVTDLGFINWKDGLKSWQSSGQTFTLKGFTMQDVQNNTVKIDDVFKPLIDSLKSSFKAVSSPQPFKTNLPTTITAGISVNPVRFLSVGVLSESQMYAGSFRESVSVSGNLHFGTMFSASASYTIANNSYDNLGFGLAFKAGFAQVYIIADKIPVSWEKYYFPKSGSDYMGIPLPGSLNVINIQLGMNIVFGKQKSKKTDIPMLQSKDQPNQ